MRPIQPKDSQKSIEKRPKINRNRTRKRALPDTERVDSIENHHFSGAILRYLSIFSIESSKKSTNLTGIVQVFYDISWRARVDLLYSKFIILLAKNRQFKVQNRNQI